MKHWRTKGNGYQAFDFEITPATPHKGYQAGFSGAPTMEAMDGMLQLGTITASTRDLIYHFKNLYNVIQYVGIYIISIEHISLLFTESHLSLVNV